DLVARALADGDVDETLPAGAIDDECVFENSEVDVSAARIELGDFFTQILRVFRVIQLAVARKEEPFRLCLHRADDVAIGDLGVAVDADSGNGESSAFVDSEVDGELPVSHRGFRLHAGEVIALALVKRVHAGDRLGDLTRIDWTAGGEGELLLDVLRGDPIGANHLVIDENRSLTHLDDERRL